MDKKTITKVLNSYGLECSRLHEIERGYRNRIQPITLTDGRQISLILYKIEPGIFDRIKRIHSVSRHLAAAGFPVRQPLDSRIICLSNGSNTRYGAVYNYLPGRTIPWESYTKHHTKLLGSVLSDLHSALVTYKPEGVACLSDVTLEYTVLNRRMRLYFGDSKVSKALKNKLGVTFESRVFYNFERLLAGCATLPDKQTLHMDLVRGNILFGDRINADDKGSITGILDFEKTAYGSPLFDIARTLAFLLVDCRYKSETQIRKYFLYSGYDKRGGSKLKDRTVTDKGKKGSLLEALVDMFLVHDFYKFLKHNPYEYLTLNEHFVRTKDILIDRRLIRSAPPAVYPYPKTAVDMVELNQVER